MKMEVYHVTSSIFIKSIKEQGLIGVDIRKKLPNLSVAMTEIIKYLELNYSNYGYDWGEPICFHDNCKRMADINYKNRSNMDYEYGSAYVTPCKRRIKIYYSCEFGSELITYFYKLYKCLFIKFNDEYKSDFDNKYPELVNIINIKEKKNLILKATVDTSDMLTDAGSEIDEKEIDLIKTLEKTEDGVQRSYRLKRALKPNEIKVFSMDGEEWIFESLLSEYEIPSEWDQVNLF